jgi:MoaA/NifB/PqqE/SkfB family radical SAM enzyme
MGKLAKAIKAVTKARIGIAKTPLITSLALTFKCNLRCSFCGIWKEHRRDILTDEQIKQLISEFSDGGMQILIFTGGEPLLRNNIKEIIDFSNDCGIYTHLVTNGTLIKNRIREIKKIDSISVSIDGPKDIHDKIRGKGVFEKSVEGLKIARDNGIFSHIISTITDEVTANNCYGIKKLLELSNDLGCKINFQPIYVDQYNYLNLKEIFPKNFVEAIEIIQHYKRKNKNVIGSNGYWNKLKDFKMNELKCYAGRLFCYVFPDGVVAPCYFTEKRGINGLEKGFLNAFNQLPSIEPHCPQCICHGSNEFNLCFSLNFESMLNAINQLTGFASK